MPCHARKSKGVGGMGARSVFNICYSYALPAYPEVLRTQVCGSLGPSVGQDDDDDDDDVGEKYSRRLPVKTTLYIWTGGLQKNQIPPSLWHVCVHEFYFFEF